MRAALDLVKAVDLLRLLQQVERATGRPWATDDDRRHVVDASAEFSGTAHARIAWKRRRQ